ncbi:MAG: FAD-dependent oxidoreductase [Nanoarchaeota archaeon]|nr:FAD-dependent oxidoreductase [Nanoarchaeota archaeon]
MEAFRFNSKLIGESKINESTKVLYFEVPENFEFSAGQYVMMAFYKDGRRILRSYSIFSSPSEKGKISIFFKKVEGGYASNFLFNMKIGEQIEMKGPLGNFTVRNPSKDIFLISSGTGFGPFKSMIKNMSEKKSPQKIYLARGFKNETDLCSEEELREISLSGNLKYFNVLSRPTDEGYIYKGHVQDFLDKFIPEGFNGDFYICGLKEMVFEVREKLGKMGIASQRIFFERYD